MKLVLSGLAWWLMLTTTHRAYAGAEPQEPPPLRNIPGITATDIFPMGCVSCHLNFIDRNMDTRISTLLTNWSEKVEPKLLELAQAVTPNDVKLTGKHPSATDSLSDIPRACLECHNRMSHNTPPFSQMVHLIHLNGGKDNHYMTLFQGECTHCHKLNPKTGEWFLPSGSEK